MGQPPVRLERILAPFNGNKKPAAIADKRAPGFDLGCGLVRIRQFLAHNFKCLGDSA